LAVVLGTVGALLFAGGALYILAVRGPIRERNPKQALWGATISIVGIVAIGAAVVLGSGSI
jgi:hypothetical protein